MQLAALLGSPEKTMMVKCISILCVNSADKLTATCKKKTKDIVERGERNEEIHKKEEFHPERRPYIP